MTSLGKHLAWTWRIAAAVLVAVAAPAAMAAAGTIVASKHDFSTSGTSGTYKSATQTQVCIYCHAPHNTTLNSGPLWNRVANITSYTLYDTTVSSTMNAATGQPGTVSKLCLSCHDGALSVDNFGGATGGTKLVTGSPNLGTNLSNDHPIGFTYNAALATADGGLKNPATATVTLGTTGVNGTINDKMLFGGKMECASCHDVHNSTARTATESKLVTLTTAGSALCIACHTK